MGEEGGLIHNILSIYYIHEGLDQGDISLVNREMEKSSLTGLFAKQGRQC